VLQAFLGMMTAIGLIAGGAIIINQNEKIKEVTKEGSDFNLLMASIFIIAGSLLVLFGLFKMFTSKSE
jgi:ATP/ADP translocase